MEVKIELGYQPTVSNIYGYVQSIPENISVLHWKQSPTCISIYGTYIYSGLPVIALQRPCKLHHVCYETNPDSTELRSDKNRIP